jgi:hypothetical protein
VQLKDDLMVIQAAPSVEEPRGSSGQLDPREGLAVTFVAAVETLRSNLMMAIMLGSALAALLMVGIDDREDHHGSARPA